MVKEVVSISFEQNSKVVETRGFGSQSLQSPGTMEGSMVFNVLEVLSYGPSISQTASNIRID